MKFAEVGDIVKIDRKKYKITEVKNLGQECYGYSMVPVKGIGFKWIGTGKKIDANDSTRKSYRLRVVSQRSNPIGLLTL